MSGLTGMSGFPLLFTMSGGRIITGAGAGILLSAGPGYLTIHGDGALRITDGGTGDGVSAGIGFPQESGGRLGFIGVGVPIISGGAR